MAGRGRGLALLTGFAVLAAGMALWAPGWLGGGDVKLLAAGALWFGWPDVVSFLVWSMLAGGVLALVLVLARRIAPAIPQNGRTPDRDSPGAGRACPLRDRHRGGRAHHPTAQPDLHGAGAVGFSL